MTKTEVSNEKIKKLYQQGYGSIKISNLLKNKLSSSAIIARLKTMKIKIRTKSYYSQREKNPNWKGGHITSQGYRRFGNNILEHREIMERYLKRKLNKTEQVHHLNGNKLDNRIENLALYTPQKHGGLSAEEYNNWRKMYQSRIAKLESIVNKLQRTT